MNDDNHESDDNSNNGTYDKNDANKNRGNLYSIVHFNQVIFPLDPPLHL